METPQIVTEIKAGFESFKAAQIEANARVEAMAKELSGKADQNAQNAIAAAQEATLKVQAQADRLTELEQRIVADVMAGKQAPQSLGQFVINSDEFKGFASGASTKIRVNASTLTGQSGSPAANNDTLTQSQRLSGVVPGAFRSLKIRDVIPSGTTASNIIEFTRELAFTNNAAETAEGVAKPETDLTFELANAPVKTIAHWIKVSKQVLDDAPMVASYVDTRLRYGVDLRIDGQLLNGDGTGQNISGLTKSGNFTAFTPTSGETALDSVNRGKYLIEAADYAADAVIMNPADWGAIERTKTTYGEYVYGNPATALGPVLWGLPVVVSNAMTAGKFMIASFGIAAQVWNRQGTTVEMTESNDTDFVKNLVTIRSEARLALAVYRPASVYYGSTTL